MQVKDVLNLTDFWKYNRNRADVPFYKLIRYVRTDIKAQLLRGVKPTDQYKPHPTLLPAIKQHKRFRVILNMYKPVSVPADKVLNGLQELYDFGLNHPDQITHLDFTVIEKLWKYMSHRGGEVYRDEIKTYFPKNTRVKIVNSKFVIMEGPNESGNTETTNTD